MTMLIRNRMSYEQIFYDNERHFADIAKKHLVDILPDFHVVDFTPFVLGNDGIRRRPDLALVHRRHQMWVVVEVELEHHSLEHHVLPQMQALTTGIYEVTHAEYLSKACPDIEIDRAKELVTYTSPQIATLVNSRGVKKKGWAILETDLQVKLMFLEIYRSKTDDTIFSLSGYIPHIAPQRITGAKTHGMLNALVCPNPDAISVSADGELRMYADDRPTYWRVLKTADSAVLIPKQPLTLRRDRNYEIRQAEDGHLLLRLL